MGKSISNQILNITTPYSEEFVRGEYSVFIYNDDTREDRYILGEHITEGFGLYYSYNVSAVPVKVPYERIVKLTNKSINEKNIKKNSKLIHDMLESHKYWEIVSPIYFDEIDNIQLKIQSLLEFLKD